MKHLFSSFNKTCFELAGLMKSHTVGMQSPRLISMGWKRNYLIVLFVYLLGTYSCIKDSPHNHNQGAVDVYIAGDVTGGPDAVFFYPVAAYWKNGNYIPLTDGTIWADAASIAVSGNDVYVAGTLGVPDVSRAVYWKNGNLRYLTDGIGVSSASSIAISGNDVYVAGSENRGTTGGPMYWKNESTVKLTDGGYVSCIFVSGNNVYAAGDADNVAKYWINGISFPIPPSSPPPANGSFYSYANSIFVAGRDVYVVGYESGEAGSFAKCWKNGISVPLGSPPGSSTSGANSIVVSGKDVYVAGRVDKNVGNTVNSTAYYWKNGIPINFTNEDGNSSAKSIAVSGNDIFIGGHRTIEGPSSSNSLATLWVNGEAFLLPGQSGASFGDANSIFISRRYPKQDAGKY